MTKISEEGLFLDRHTLVLELDLASIEKHSQHSTLFLTSKKGLKRSALPPRKGHSRWFEYPTFNVKKACLVSKTWTVAGQSMAT